MKRFFSILISFIVVGVTLTACFITSASATPNKPKKIVSVVYDDSGSMRNKSNTWEYASYGIQTLAGLLDKDDVLYVTYMSNKTEYKSYNLKDKQDAIDSIRSHKIFSKTPYKAIETANKALVDYYVKHSSDKSDYWLITFTDGSLNDADSVESVVADAYELDKKEGFQLNNIYFPLGKKAMIRNEQINGVRVYDGNSDGTPDKIKTGDEFIEALGKEADQISGRIRINKDDIKLEGSNTLKFKSALPLYKIVILSQKSDAIVKAAKCPECDLSISSPVSLRAPEKLTSALKGTATEINRGDKNTPASTYTITFKDKVDLNSIVVMTEPAIEIKLTVLKGKKPVRNIKDLTEGDLVDIKGKIVEAGTDKTIDESLLPDGSSFKTGYKIGGGKDSSSSLFYKNIRLKLDDTELYTSITLPGFLPIKDTTGSFKPNKMPQYKIICESDKYDITQSNLYNRDAKPLLFTVYRDGKLVTYEEAKNLDFKIKPSYGFLGSQLLDGKVKLRKDGKFAYCMRYGGTKRRWMFSFITPFFNSVKARIGASESESVPVNIWWAFPFDWLINILQILLYAWIINIIVKPKFPFFGKLCCATITYTYRNENSGVITRKNISLTNLRTVLKPSLRAKKKVSNDIYFVAQGFRNSYVNAKYKQKDGIIYKEGKTTNAETELRAIIRSSTALDFSAGKRKRSKLEKTIRPKRALMRINKAKKGLIECALINKKEKRGTNTTLKSKNVNSRIQTKKRKR